MPSCAVCTHDQRKAIEAELLSGKSQRSTARRYALRPAAVQRHVVNHLRANVILNEAREETTVRGQVQKLLDRADAYLRRCEQEGSKLTPAMYREVRGCLETIGRISGEVPTGSQVTVNFFQKLGVRDESEALGLICQARLLRDANADGDEDSALEVLEGVLRDDPARREPLSRKLMRMIGDVARVDSQPASLGSSPPSRRPRPAPLNGGSNGLPA